MNLFAFLLPGLSAMFLLFLADVAMRDLHREVRFRTYDRLCTFPVGSGVFVLGKVVFTFVVLGLGALVLLGGGSLLFGFRWADPLAVAGLALGLALFAGGLMGALNGLVGSEKRADVLNTVVGMAIAMAAGCAFPADALPGFLRHYLTPWLPPHWFLEAVRATQFPPGAPVLPWPWTAAAMGGIGLVLVALTGALLRRRLARGIRA